MGKRNSKEDDIPRRIYKSTIDRIDKHLNYRKRPGVTVKREIKGDFNKFLILLIDTYEHLLDAKAYYANTLHEDVSEARGEAILLSKKTGTQVKWPKQVLILGEDDL